MGHVNDPWLERAEQHALREGVDGLDKRDLLIYALQSSLALKVLIEAHRELRREVVRVHAEVGSLKAKLVHEGSKQGQGHLKPVEE